MEYNLVQYRGEHANLSMTIQDLLNEGWELYGNLSVVVVGEELVYTQVLTKKKKSKRKIHAA